MPNRPPKSYDEIVRKTVREIDGSWRPSPDQERLAYAGYRALDPEEQEIFDCIHETLLAHGYDPGKLIIEVDHDRVLLRGGVRDRKALQEIPELVRRVDGVRQVNDQLVLAAD